jgi:hypothetical protein
MRSLGLEHPRPSSFILHSRLNGNLKLLGDFVGLGGFRDEPDGADLAGRMRDERTE